MISLFVDYFTNYRSLAMIKNLFSANTKPDKSQSIFAGTSQSFGDFVGKLIMFGKTYV
jgi:hypothetical protein